VVQVNLVSTASNLRGGSNPPYALEDFYINYPAYGPRELSPSGPDAEPAIQYLVDPGIMHMYLDLANACLQESRWRSYWKIAMGWFIAHFLTLYLQSMVGADSPAAQVINAGQARGLQSSKSVGDVSVSYDFSTAMGDLDGWAAWKLTVYGQQLATAAKLVGKGGMYVW
jgi:hypothetical protein